MSAIEDVVAERAAQDAKWGEQNHPAMASGQGAGYEEMVCAAAADRANHWKSENAGRAADGTIGWDGILLEEVYEALAESDAALLRAELVQAAAVAVAWIECIDRAATR